MTALGARGSRLGAAALLLALPGLPSGARAGAVDEALVPGGAVLSTIFPSSEEEVFRVAGTAGSSLQVDLRPLGRGPFRPSLRCVLSDGTPLVVPAKASGKTKARLPFPADGTCVLTVAAASDGPGHYRLKTKLRPRPAGPRGGNLDLRVDLDPSILGGAFGAFLALPTPVGLVPSAAGEVDFDGRGGLVTRLAPVEAGTLPLPGLPTAPTVEGGGTYATDGSIATVALDGLAYEGLFTVAAGGDALAAGFGEADPDLVALLLRREVPTAATLAGSFAWVDASGNADGGTLETGNLVLSASGTASGIGVRTSYAPGPDGIPVAGDATPLLRTGTFTIAADGTVTVVTRENLFGPTATWEFRTVLGVDILAGAPAPGADALALRALLRQGSGLGDDAVTGDYLHLGVSAGAATALTTGVLAFDGAGGWAGIESGAPVTGSYTVNANGLATLVPSGGAARTGVVGPEARYLLAFGFAEGGLAMDLLIAAE